MPELPEVETVARQLRQVILDRPLQSIEIRKAKSFSGVPENFAEHSITEVTRRSKILRLHFSNHLNLLIHLKMSGQLIFVDGEKRVGGGHPTADWVDELPSKHTRVIFHFQDGTSLYFNDQRMFGWVRDTSDEDVESIFSKFAPDVIDGAFTTDTFFHTIHSRKIPIKQLIMDNEVVAGVGNIYACDALNLAKILPTRPGNSLTKKDAQRLLDAMRTVIFLGIELGGATAHGKYVHITGLAGKYQDSMRVYNRAGEACPNCSSSIQKIKVAGRGTYFCPICQI